MINLISLTGPSGAGKTTIAGEILLQRRAARMVQSYTTRERRHNDLPGEYCYISQAEFNAMVDRKMFLWTAEHGGTHYGTSAPSIEDIFALQGQLGIMILVPQVIPLLITFLRRRGFRSRYLPFFIEPPSHEELECRLRLRGDDPANIEVRLKQSRYWLHEAVTSEIDYTYIKNNDVVEAAVNEIIDAVQQ